MKNGLRKRGADCWLVYKSPEIIQHIGIELPGSLETLQDPRTSLSQARDNKNETLQLHARDQGLHTLIFYYINT